MFFDKEPDAVFEELVSSPDGLTNDEAERRYSMYGKNIVFRVPKVRVLPIFLSQFKRVSIYALLFLLFLSILVGDYLKALIVVPILIFNAYMGYRKLYLFQHTKYLLRDLSTQQVKALRDGAFRPIDSKDIVPGDIIYLEAGERVPADARLLELDDLETVESRITGRYETVKKSLKLVVTGSPFEKQTNMVFCGTTVIKGYCKAVVVRTGSDTYLGDMFKNQELTYSEHIPLQSRLACSKKWLELFIVGASLFVLGVAIFISSNFLDVFLRFDWGSYAWYKSLFVSVQEYLYLAVAFSVASVPAGLATLVSDSLSRGFGRLKNLNLLVRRLSPILDLGYTSALCSDITGIVTEHTMTVRKMLVNGTVMEVTGEGYDSQGDILKEGVQVKAHEVDLILKLGILNNDASIDGGSYLGDPTEQALIISATKAGLQKKDIDRKFPRIADIPFDSDRRRKATLHKTGNKNYLVVKGACDSVLDLCAGVIIKNKVQKMTPELKESILKESDNFSHEGLKVLAFAFRTHEGTEIHEEKLIFVGLQALENPLRKGAVKAIEELHHAGVNTVFVTGENLNTALAIGSRLGLQGNAINASDLDRIQNLEDYVDDVSIVGCASSAHKLKIVSALRNKGYAVTVTGDSMNDAFTLEKADVGVSLGVGGTDIAKEASDVMVSDDDISSLVGGVRESRGITENIKKFMMAILSGNLALVFILLVPSFIALLFGTDFVSPVEGIHLLWIALITDGIISFMLLRDPVRPSIMRRKPHSMEGSLLKNWDMLSIAVIAVMIYGLTTYLMNLDTNIEKVRTMAFTSIVVFQIVKVMIVRLQHKVWFFSNKKLWASLAIGILLQGVVVYVPLFQQIFHTVGLTMSELLYIGTAATGMFAVGVVLSVLMSLRKDI
ncbi:MAG: cation-translocating P-type ATPase [Nanobdellota archaeon]